MCTRGKSLSSASILSEGKQISVVPRMLPRTVSSNRLARSSLELEEASSAAFLSVLNLDVASGRVFQIFPDLEVARVNFSQGCSTLSGLESSFLKLS